LRTLHTGERYRHENGSVVEIIAPVYQGMTKPPVRYRLKKVDGQKEFTYSKDEIRGLIIDGKLKRIF